MFDKKTVPLTNRMIDPKVSILISLIEISNNITITIKRIFAVIPCILLFFKTIIVLKVIEIFKNKKILINKDINWSPGSDSKFISLNSNIL